MLFRTLSAYVSQTMQPEHVFVDKIPQYKTYSLRLCQFDPFYELEILDEG